MSTASSPFAVESGHWYLQDGTPAYEVPNKSKRIKCEACTGSMRGAEAKARTLACLVCDVEGYTYPEMRGTTLRDAKVIDAGRSTTGVLRAAGVPWGLVQYQLTQFADAAFTATDEIEALRKANDRDAWLMRILADAEEHKKQAAKKGTDIHATVERALRGESLEGFIYADWYVALEKVCREHWGFMPEFDPERSFACEYGYGCKADAHCKKLNFMADFKTKDFALVDGVYEAPGLEDEHLMQLAANAVCADMRGAEGGIFFIDRERPLVELKMATSDQMARGWKMFRCLLELSRLKDEWKPTWATAA